MLRGLDRAAAEDLFKDTKKLIVRLQRPDYHIRDPALNGYALFEELLEKHGFQRIKS